jgi:shingomyelin synthase
MSEIAMLSNTIMAITITMLNKHRWTLLKRVLLISAMLYGGRAISMLVTQVPVADPKYYCSPKLNDTSVTLVLERAISLVSGLGLSIGGKHVLCGDYIYSGHTVVLVHGYYIVRYYTPRRWWPLHTLSWFLAVFGVVCLLLSRGHYTVDIVIAYWITSRLFIAYHTMCAIPALRHRTHVNLMSKMCWFRLFLYMEKDIPCKVPLRFEWPLPWPRALVRSTSKTNMY